MLCDTVRHLLKSRNRITIWWTEPHSVLREEPMMRFRLRPLVALCAVVAAVVLIAAGADARASRGGSRGTQTYSAPPTTKTAPNAAKPVERSMTQPNQSA